MVLNSFAGRFVISSILAERQGVTDPSARTRLAVLGGVLGSSATGLVVTTVLARREAEAGQNGVTPSPLPPPPPPPPVLLPNLIGMSIENAAAELAKLNLSFNEMEVHSPEEAGTVVMQSWDVGTPISNIDRLTLLVSAGKGMPEINVPVPRVVSETLRTAKAKLACAGFEVEVNPPGAQDYCIVMEQVPAVEDGSCVKHPQGEKVMLSVDESCCRTVVQ
jgi:hypothetical protein